jgi:serine/threonine protein phosphatase 1
LPGKRYVIGDIHGAHKALLECFEKVSFDRDHDLLISLGDVCDGWPEVNKVFDELLMVKNLVYILGNHDKWALDWFLNRRAPAIWTQQGGKATMASYKGEIPESHVQLLSGAHLFYILERKVFVHGGFDPAKAIEDQDEQVFLWDRELVYNALRNYFGSTDINITGYDRVYVGHTPTINFSSLAPLKIGELVLMDTGAGWPGGVLTMMDIDTLDYVSSSPVDELYREFRGRG